MMTFAPLLTLEHVSKSFGGVQVVRDLNLSLSPGQTTALIGPNGAGKTTVFNLINGVFSPDEGRITFKGVDITSVPSRHRVGCGIARSFQNIRLMPHLTVCENLMVGFHVRANNLSSLLMPVRMMPRHRFRRQAAAALSEAGLEAYLDATASELPYGIRKRIDLVRATLTGASLLMLDEPAAGLNPTETNGLRSYLERLKERGIMLLVVEHDMQFIDHICDHVVVLNFGEKIAEGPLSVVQRDAQVRAAYLGLEEATT
jgi:ABC-type branched-subunit amino acid transport system ATPase component